MNQVDKEAELSKILHKIYNYGWVIDGVGNAEQLPYTEAKEAITALIDLRCLEARLGELRHLPRSGNFVWCEDIDKRIAELTQATDSASSGGGTSEHQSVPLASQETEEPHE